MTEDSYRDMVIDHDKHIDSLTTSVNSLADSVGATHRKLDDVIDVITHQNVLQEKLSNLDLTFRESFNRVHTRVDDLEEDMPKKVSWAFVQWLAVIIIAYSVSFGIYTNHEIHRLDVLANEKIMMQREINKKNVETHDRIQRNCESMRNKIKD